MNRGMTLLEMVIALSMMAVVFVAVVPAFAAIRNGWAVNQGDAEVLQNARVLTEHIYQHLVTAAAVTDVSGPAETDGYIELTDCDDQSLRYELSSDGYVRFGSPGELAVLAGPVSALAFTCYDGSDFSASTTEVGAIRLVTIEATFPASTSLGSARSYETSAFLRIGALGESTTVTVDPGILVQDDVGWGGWGTTIDSYRSSQGPYDELSPGSEAVVSVNATGKNTFELWSGTTLRGDVYIGPDGDLDRDIGIWGGSVVTGSQGVLPEVISLPSLSAPAGPPFDDGHEGKLVIRRKTVVLSSDHHYKTLEIEDGGTLQIDGDVTILVDGKVEIYGSGKIEVLADSSLRLYCSHKVDIGGTSQINAAGADPTRLGIYLLNGKNFTMTSQAQVHGVVQNPGGWVRIYSDAQLFGKLTAWRLEGGGQIHVDLDCDFDMGED